jgi:protein-tyrosine phosphatase
MPRFFRALSRRWRAFIALRRARATSRARLSAGPIQRVLVVCYGNIYRSPLLAEYLRKSLAGTAVVRSVGFHQRAGRPSPERHVQMCAGLGVHLEAHRSAVIEHADLAWADTIILMDWHNWDALHAMGADPQKLVWAGCLHERGPAIPDPYGHGEEAARRVVTTLLESGEQLTAAICSKHGGSKHANPADGHKAAP